MLPSPLESPPQLVEVRSVRPPDYPQPLNEDPQLLLELPTLTKFPPPGGLQPTSKKGHDLGVDGRDGEGSRGRWKGGGGGGGGAILGTGLLVAGGPFEGSPWVSGVEAMEEEAEEDEGVDEGLAGGHEEVHDLVGGGFGRIPLVWRGGGSQGETPPQFRDVVSEEFNQFL